LNRASHNQPLCSATHQAEIVLEGWQNIRNHNNLVSVSHTQFIRWISTEDTCTLSGPWSGPRELEKSFVKDFGSVLVMEKLWRGLRLDNHVRASANSSRLRIHGCPGGDQWEPEALLTVQKGWKLTTAKRRPRYACLGLSGNFLPRIEQHPTALPTP
jgi:hypothetical protein